MKKIIKVVGIDVDYLVKTQFGYSVDYEFVYKKIKDFIDFNSFMWVGSDGDCCLFIEEVLFDKFIKRLKKEIKK